MAKDFSSMEDSNRSSNPSIHEVSDPARRIVVRGGLSAAVSGLLAPLVAGCVGPQGALSGRAWPSGPQLGFTAVPAGTADDVHTTRASCVRQWTTDFLLRPIVASRAQPS